MNARTDCASLATGFVIPPMPTRSLPVKGSTARFPVGRIFCVGRNYAEHAREMGHNPEREPPFFFMKPSSAIVSDGADFPYPALSEDVHHEVELVVAIGREGCGITVEEALDHVWGYGVGFDMTRRDLQSAAKKMGRPWDTGKGFDASAPCSEIVPAAKVGHPGSGRIELKVNGQVRQAGDLSDLIWSVPETIAFLSTLFRLHPGDLVFTGTPAGVGPVSKGDHLLGVVQGVAQIDLRVV